MLENAHLLAKIGADTAENEQQLAEILPIDRRVADRRRPARRRALLASGGRGVRAVPGGLVFRAYGENWQMLQFFLKNFANFWRARSPLYQNEILREKAHFSVYIKIYRYIFQKFSKFPKLSKLRKIS